MFCIIIIIIIITITIIVSSSSSSSSSLFISIIIIIIIIVVLFGGAVRERLVRGLAQDVDLLVLRGRQIAWIARALRPISALVLRFWISEGLTRAAS